MARKKVKAVPITIEVRQRDTEANYDTPSGEWQVMDETYGAIYTMNILQKVVMDQQFAGVNTRIEIRSGPICDAMEIGEWRVRKSGVPNVVYKVKGIIPQDDQVHTDIMCVRHIEPKGTNG